MSSMTDSGRGPKDSRRRSSKQQPKTSHAPSPAVRSRPKSDLHGTSSRSTKHTSAAGRPLLQDRTHSEPVESVDDGATSATPSLTTTSPYSETFLLRPSIDHAAATAISSVDPTQNDVDGHTDSRDGDASVENADAVHTKDRSSCTSRRSIVRVVGAAGSGKSTFVQQYLHAPGSRGDNTGGGHETPSSLNSKPDVTFQELSIDDIDVLDDGRIIWPNLREQLGQTVGGVVVLYDVMNRASFLGVQKIIKALSGASTPAALVASKCDYPPEERVIHPDAVEEKVKNHFEQIRLFRMSRLVSDSPRACVASLLDDHATGSTERPIKQAAYNSGSSSSSHEPSHKMHAQQLQTHPSTEELDSGAVDPAPVKNVQRRSKSEAQLQIQTSLGVPDIAGDISPHTFLNLEDSPRPSFGPKLETGEETDLTGLDEVIIPEDVLSPTDSAVTFDELTTKLLYPTSNKADAKFIAAFLTFYRFFASPLSLLDAVIKHFDAHDGNIITPWVHEPILDRDLTIIDRWINVYPGDFAKAVIRQKLRKFLSRVAREHGVGEGDGPPGLTDGGTLIEKYGEAATLAASASQITLALDFVGEDDDTDWGYSDSGPFRRSRSNTFLSMSSLDSRGEYDPSELDEPLSKITSTNPAYDAKLIFGGQSTLTLTAMGRSRRHPDSGSSSQTLLNVAESAQRQATLLSPKPTQSFGKTHWRAFMAHPDDQIARELTRIDWIMFSSIRPRDLIRHVTIPTSERGRFHALENVSRMIDHFNHLAFWVTNVVLFRDKPKHRAQALEKFMRVGRKLRELNNYNALGALIAGIQGTAVHRLKATKELVSQSVQKDFMKLEILMAATKGHWAYRLAWENTSTERVPFLPLHRRDLVVAEAGARTFVEVDKATSPTSSESDASTIQQTEESADTSKLENETPTSKASQQSQSMSQSLSPSKRTPRPGPNARINWRKFHILGEILENLTQAQSTPYVGFTANEEVRSLVLDHVIVKDDDELYERSTVLEPPTSNPGYSAGSGITPSAGGPAVRKKVKDRMAQFRT